MLEISSQNENFMHCLMSVLIACRLCVLPVSLTDLESKSMFGTRGLNASRQEIYLEAFIFNKVLSWQMVPVSLLCEARSQRTECKKRLKFAKISEVQRRHGSLQRWSGWGERKKSRDTSLDYRGDVASIICGDRLMDISEPLRAGMSSQLTV